MLYEYDVIIEQDEEGWFVASVPELRGCHTQAKSLDEVMARIREAIAACVDDQGAGSKGSQFVGVQRVAIEA